MNARFLGLAALFLALTAVLSGIAFAEPIPINIIDVKIDGDSLGPYSVNRLAIERGEEIEVKVIFTAYGDADNVQVEAEIRGYEHDDDEKTSDITDVFDIEENATYSKKLEIEVPGRVEEDDYKLWVTITDRYDELVVQGYNLKIEAPRHSMVIRDIILNPENEVKAGRALLASVRVKNMGGRDEDSVKVSVSIPGLGLSASEYIDEVESDDSETSGELYFRIPACAELKNYDVVARVEYDDGGEEITDSAAIRVAEGDMCETAASQQDSEPDVSAGSTAEDVVPLGQEAVFPISIKNNAKSSKTFVVNADGVAGWGEATISPSNTVVVGAGETKNVNVRISAGENAVLGEKAIIVTVTEGSEAVDEILLTANVLEPERDAWSAVKKVLEVTLVVLVALLVILGLIIGFNRLKGEETGEASGEMETYY